MNEQRRDILVEAEALADPGGWVVDQQSMDQMGSPYLLAHGLGVPVRDATGMIDVPAPGSWRVWVRTRDWAHTRQAGEAPGRFQLLIDGVPLSTIFGTEGAAWHWQDGGPVTLPARRATIALHDLTGFEGRADAILFSADPGFVPPDAGPALDAFRRIALGLPPAPADAGSFDLVVAGGGIPGICAALTAAREGLSVAFVQDRPVLGGNNSSEVRVWLGGETNLPPYPDIGNVVRELEQARKAHYGPSNTADLYEDNAKLALVRAEKRITLFLGYRVISAETGPAGLESVVAQDIRTSHRVRLAGRLFADCTGDGALGALAGADFEATAKGHMGPSNLWHIKDTGSPSPFPRCPWALDLAHAPFPGRDEYAAQFTDPGPDGLGAWFWECGFDWDPVADVERMRDWNLLAMYGAWDALKNTLGKYPNGRLAWAAWISGKRESRRLLGDVIVTRDDVRAGRKFEDACFPCTWGVDLHRPHPAFAAGLEGREFISEALIEELKQPFWAPYRALYSRNVPNLFMAGRDISVTHEALGTARVMRTGGMMGEVIGLAASLCVRRSTSPRGVYESHLPELVGLLTRGPSRPR
ncbi:MAG: FAD-dependent oxidoreductase [Candidatus Coatesbacteria bacterium]